MNAGVLIPEGVEVETVPPDGKEGPPIMIAVHIMTPDGGHHGTVSLTGLASDDAIADAILRAATGAAVSCSSGVWFALQGRLADRA